MTFLDTVDGKLARVTVNSSYFGHLFDHAIDLISPPFWYLIWGLGLESWQPGIPAFAESRILADLHRLHRRTPGRGNLQTISRTLGHLLLAPDRLIFPPDHRKAQPQPDPAHPVAARRAARPGAVRGGILDGRFQHLPGRAAAHGLLPEPEHRPPALLVPRHRPRDAKSDLGAAMLLQQPFMNKRTSSQEPRNRSAEDPAAGQEITIGMITNPRSGGNRKGTWRSQEISGPNIRESITARP